MSSTFGDGFTTWQNPSYTPSYNVTISGNRAGLLRYNGGWQGANYYLPVGDAGGNTGVAAGERRRRAGSRRQTSRRLSLRPTSASAR